MSPELGRALISIAFGAAAGGITNAVAVWMLFHPYEPPKLFGWRIRLLQGAIPKNKARLAGAIGKTVGKKLLTAEDLADTLTADPEIRQAFDARLSGFVAGMLDRDRGSLTEILPLEVATQLRDLLREVVAGLLQRFDSHLDSDEFRSRAQEWAVRLARELEDQPLSDILTPEREAAITESADKWIIEMVGGDGFARAVDDYIDRGAHRLLVPGRTFQEIVPPGMVSALERAIAGYLPIALEKLGHLLEDAAARQRVERILHEILDRFMADLKFHQRLVAALLITPDVIDRVLGAVEKEGASKLSELLQDDDVRDAMARGVNNAIVDFLAKPVVSVLGEPGDQSVTDAKQTMAGWAVSLAQDDHTRAFLVDKLKSALNAAEGRTWGDIFKHVPPERVADTVTAALRSDRAGELYREAADRVIDQLMQRPIGKLAAHLPADAPQRIESAIAEPLWLWAQEQVPAVAQRIDIAKRVEQKIIDFPIQQVEAIIKGVTERELKLIVDLGWVLGAIIGLGSVLIGMVLG
jgi:uncharacterized membrane protein YheB (UPF0754 family)